MIAPEPTFRTAVDYLASGQLDRAEARFREILVLQPDHAPSLDGLGIVAIHLDDPALASRLFARAAAGLPDDAVIWAHLGFSEQAAGALIRSGRALRRSLVLTPGVPEVLEGVGRITDQECWYRRSLAVSPGSVAAWINFGSRAQRAGNVRGATHALKCALASAPDASSGWFNLGSVLAQGDKAIAVYERVLALDPLAIDAATNRARLLADTLPTRAEGALRRSLVASPAVAPALTALARLYQSAGNGKTAQRWFARAYAADATNPALHSNWILQLSYDPDLSRSYILKRHLRWALCHGVAQASSQVAVVDPNKMLRVGYVSADLGHHPVGHFLLPAVAHRSSEAIETVCYSGRRNRDAWTQRLEAAADQWVEVADLSDSDLAERIRADGIDILVDLSGHTAGNRLPIFASKPAPIQVTWMGYPGTTGLSQVDYIIGDTAQIPSGDEHWYVERVVRLDPGYVSYSPPGDAPDVKPLPAGRLGRVTFGSLNNLAKLNPSTLDLWAKVLAAVPGSRLLLAWQSLADHRVAGRIREAAVAAGIPSSCLELRPGGEHSRFLDTYGDIDIALDPAPYSGGLTTVEALWMGVPVLTLPGSRFSGRHAASHLTQVGLSDWIVSSFEGYVAHAASAAGNFDHLADLRASLRHRLRGSSLLDGASFARRLEAAYRKMWHTWCAHRKAP